MESLLVASFLSYAPQNLMGGTSSSNAPPIRPYRWRIFFQCATLKNGPSWNTLQVAHSTICATHKILIGGAYSECATPKALWVAHLQNAPPLWTYWWRITEILPPYELL